MMVTVTITTSEEKLINEVKKSYGLPQVYKFFFREGQLIKDMARIIIFPNSSKCGF